MPLFEFECDSCRDHRDEFADSPADGPECCGDRMRRVFSPTAINLGPQPHLMSDAELYMHHRHRKDIEKAYKEGKLASLKERGPMEFRPRLEKG